ncbi:PD-(D/E)XK nuclease family protein [uncultured Ferrimonas sp.]|uniref:PDDEXK-like family protein n=1 Tax=uncultured Ferrimonas sp. TaxID=432640 RepID=UPI0026237716|nr:PD-(D/E)XK nuclease family protein [uncultured Ferrimonas sp.]
MLAKYTQLLQLAQALPQATPTETSIFAIGSKGYFENPTTDILAFFCNDNAEHGLGSLLVRALLSCLAECPKGIDHTLSATPEREVATKSGKRIDLLLESDQWALVLENKIHHQQNNPFDAYEDFVHREYPQRFKHKQPLFVVLSPTGEVPAAHPNWQGISYPDLVQAIKQGLAEHFIDQPLNKWVILLREFILHLEGLMAAPATPQHTIDFVLDNLAAIQELQIVKKKAINDYQLRLQQQLQNHFKQPVTIHLHHWDQYPALRFALTRWEDSGSDVVLYLDGNEEDKTNLRCYAQLTKPAQFKVADEYLAHDCHGSPWLESQDNYRGYSYVKKLATQDDVVALLIAKITALNEFEQHARPGLKG